MKAKFKDIPSAPGYQVTPCGKVKSPRGKILSPYLSSSGYEFLGVTIDGKRKNQSVHRLVVEAFSGSIPEGMWVNHKDGNKQNNHVDNLEITTPSNNHLHASRVLKRKYARGDGNPLSILTNEGRDAAKELKALGWSQRKIARALQVSQPAISKLLKNENWTK